MRRRNKAVKRLDLMDYQLDERPHEHDADTRRTENEQAEIDKRVERYKSQYASQRRLKYGKRAKDERDGDK